MNNELRLYLQAKGFIAHPFATTNAEQETDQLPSFFLRADWFDQLVGDPQNPTSILLFAPQGYGKTSHRLEVARIVSEPSREHRALVVMLDDVHLLLREAATIESYISLIRRKTLEALKKTLSPVQLQSLQQRNEEAFYRLDALLRLYAPRQALSRTEPHPIIKLLMQEYQDIYIGPREWLKEELYPLVRQAGFASIYVLLDGLDESPATRDNPEAIFHLLTPLLDTPGLLQGCGFAFKFFLPQNLQQPMQQQQIGRLDRIPQRLLSWNEAQLVAMLSQRLSSYSRVSETSAVSMVNSFQELCEVDFDPDIRLARAAQASPRRLIDLAREILERHCETVPGADTMITAETIDKVLKPYEVTGRSPATPVSSAAALPTGAPDPPLACDDLGSSIPPLFLDERGDIWFGEQRQNLRLPKLLRKCMDYLWHNRQRVVRYDELCTELYGADLSGRADPEGSCDKLIQRLRKALEPSRQRSSYIETQPGAGYVVRNYCEDHVDIAADVPGISSKNP